MPPPDRTGATKALFLGTSLTAGLGLPEPTAQSWPGVVQQLADSAGIPFFVVNAGLSGETSAGALRRADWVLKEKYDVIVIETGANDGLRGLNFDSTAANVRGIIRKARAANPGATIFLMQMEAPTNMGSWDRPAHAQLDTIHLDWLRAVPKTSVFREKVFLCHATPEHDEIYWLETVQPDGAVRMSSLDAIEERAKGITQSLMLCAHTHVARAVQLRDGRLIVNPGSVGSPGYRDIHPFPHVIEAGTPDARYAILELTEGNWQVTFRHVPYDHATMAALARQNGQAELANALATGWIG